MRTDGSTFSYDLEIECGAVPESRLVGDDAGEKEGEQAQGVVYAHVVQGLQRGVNKLTIADGLHDLGIEKKHIAGLVERIHS